MFLDLGLLDGHLPIPILDGAGQIQILPFLRNFDLRLRLREFSLLKFSVLGIDHESPEEIKLSADDHHLLRIEQLQVLRDRHRRTLDITSWEARIVAKERRMIAEDVPDTDEEIPTPGVPDLDKGVVIA